MSSSRKVSPVATAPRWQEEKDDAAGRTIPEGGTQRARSRRWITWATVVVGALLVAVAVWPMVPRTTLLRAFSDPPEARSDGGNDRVPSETARDWATYGDHLAELTLVDVTARPAAKEYEPGKRRVARLLTFRVEDVAWSRDQAPKLPETITWPATGWTEVAGVRGPLPADHPRCGSGQRMWPH